MVVGFTGTRVGMTPEQRQAVRDLLTLLRPGLVVHGDCVGADYDFDEICSAWFIDRQLRPCTAPPELRAHCELRGAVVVAKPVSPMDRNRAIVAQCDWLIACPPNDTIIKSGSGTWATVRFGHRAGIGVSVVAPSGQLIAAHCRQPEAK